MIAKQLALFPELPLTARHRPKLTQAQYNVLSWILLGRSLAGTFPARRTRVLRQLILDGLVEVVSLAPAVYRVTESGIDLRRGYEDYA